MGKTIKQTVELRPIYRAAKGHPTHHSGAGTHAQGIRRLRNRQAIKNFIQKEGYSP
jgi:hypothetical protein